MKVAIVGYGVVGRAYHKVFPDAYIYDEPQKIFFDPGGSPQKPEDDPSSRVSANPKFNSKEAKESINQCDIALVCVPTDLNDNDLLDMSIVDEVVGWLETPLILIKSALMPGTVDSLVKKTGKKIAVSIEYIGESIYPVHFWKYPHQNDPRFHSMLVIGGEEDTATQCAEIMWNRLSPDIEIHIVSAREAEITKLIENFSGALKVTFINTIKSLADKSDSNFVKIQQAWQADPRAHAMHVRTVSFKRGWKSKCWDKDVQALSTYAKEVGALDMQTLADTIIKLNAAHLKLSE